MMCHASTPEYFVQLRTEIIIDTETAKPLFVLDAFQQCLCIQPNQVYKEGDSEGKGAGERRGKEDLVVSVPFEQEEWHNQEQGGSGSCADGNASNCPATQA